MAIAIQNTHAKAMFEYGDALRQGRLRHTNRLGGTAQRAVPRHGEQFEQSARIQSHLDSLCSVNETCFQIGQAQVAQQLYRTFPGIAPRRALAASNDEFVFH